MRGTVAHETATVTAPAVFPSDEAALVERARHDAAAFAPLYARYADPVYRYCYRLLGTREAAEDATSLVFTKALEALPRFRAGSFRSWLFAIAHNVIANERKRVRPALPLEAGSEVAARAPTPEDLAVAADTGDRLRALLAALPTDQRQVAELRLAGLSGIEIAEATGKSHAAVRMLQMRAVARLRRSMGVETNPGKEGGDG